MRDKLSNMIQSAVGGCAKYWADVIADKLIAEGVIVPPCKVGDKTYLLLEKLKGGYAIVVSKCVGISENENGKWFSMYFDCVDIGNSIEFQSDDFGKTVFLTREEAERALERSENGK